jgi:hypothetical protein
MIYADYDGSRDTAEAIKLGADRTGGSEAADPGCLFLMEIPAGLGKLVR